jgi:Domain of unknown function (DUF4157)
MQRTFRPGSATLLSPSLDADPRGVPGKQTLVQAKRELSGGGALEAAGVPGRAGLTPEPSAASSGAPMAAPLLERMEALFGARFGDVRIHEDGEAAAMGAQAFARGNHLHFQPGRFDPGSTAGLELLGHELSHVVQQRAGRVSGPQGKDGIAADPALEAEADAHGARVARSEQIAGGGGAGVSEAVGAEAVQCKDLTAQQISEMTKNQTWVWRWVQNVAGGHITIFLDDATKQWLSDNLLTNVVRLDGYNKIRLDTLGGHPLSYDELHFKTIPGDVHYYYREDGTPLANCKATGAPSPPWNNAGWATANARIATYLGIDRYALNAQVNQLAGRKVLPESADEVLVPRVHATTPKVNPMLAMLRSKQLRNGIKKPTAVPKKVEAVELERKLSTNLPKKHERDEPQELPHDLLDEDCKEPLAKRHDHHDPEDPPDDGGIAQN